MSTENHIWELVAKRLANEAAAGELQELHELLKKNRIPTAGLKLLPTGGERTSRER